MQKLTTLFKKLRLRQVLTVCLVSVLLIFSAACSNATTAQGANPNNPAVQAGGNNNPHKNPGVNYNNVDKYTTDPTVKETPDKSPTNRASLDGYSLLVAANSEGLLYPGAETPAGRAEKETELPIKTAKDFKQPEAGGLNQRNEDLGERLGNRLEKVQEAFKEASEFTQEKAAEGSRRPEAQSNPALGQ
ncbi:hypothetical protein H6G17_23765 [Chroococcidiopsis sp. FACHB-1243]|uniref:DUF6658 family protein n=1 Tax=Chroococcidiopsis sp. [FACHB-1243] TaxID=2692781 RepID=UPI00178025C3|nr:DUF6658 family protein [Chroococcidiopsis sp. [FACHB-1243]]MBD2308495.1 hypothetical protein [Chroococcidiopsis sp. [FACHB-1243]]